VAIEAGEHGEGSTLPAAALIAERYGVNRHTVRQALRYLQDLGLVTVERGRGTIVRGQRFPYRLGRRVSFRTNFGAAGIDAAGDVIESSIGSASAELAQQLHLGEGSRVWEIRTLSRAAGVAVSTSVHWLGVERFPNFDRRLVAARASITAAFATYGISDYIRLSTRLSARAATRDEARLLGLPRAAPVLQSAAIDGLEDGTPLQVVVGAFAGERVEMVLEQPV
jgi:GntR family phosphonate transport system transcriptional regulator